VVVFLCIRVDQSLGGRGAGQFELDGVNIIDSHDSIVPAGAELCDC